MIFHLNTFTPSKGDNGSKLKNATKLLKLYKYIRNDNNNKLSRNDNLIKNNEIKAIIIFVAGPTADTIPSIFLLILKNLHVIPVYPDINISGFPIKIPAIKFINNVMKKPIKLNENFELHP